MFEVRFYRNQRGDAPVRDYIDLLEERPQDKVLAFIKKLEREGHLLRRPTAGYLGGKLWELRPDQHRILYAFYDRTSIVLLHAILKKSYPVPSGDMGLALKRLDDWMRRGRYE